jgi:hypothetical protein
LIAAFLFSTTDGKSTKSMQWLINRFEAFKKEVTEKVDRAISAHAERQIEAAAEVQKLKGEISALKARMGKKQD